MIGKITPLVKVAGWRTWATASALHLAGAAAAAGASGWLLGVVGQLLGLRQFGPVAGSVVLVLAVGALLDAGLIRGHLPQLPRQTPAWFPCAFGPVWGSLFWGVDLGLGWSTQSCFTTYFGAAVLVTWLGAPAWGALALGMYGIGRGIPVIAAGLASWRIPLQELTLQPVRVHERVRLANGVALGSAAGFVAVMLLP